MLLSLRRRKARELLREEPAGWSAKEDEVEKANNKEPESQTRRRGVAGVVAGGEKLNEQSHKEKAEEQELDRQMRKEDERKEKPDEARVEQGLNKRLREADEHGEDQDEHEEKPDEHEGRPDEARDKRVRAEDDRKEPDQARAIQQLNERLREANEHGEDQARATSTSAWRKSMRRSRARRATSRRA
ncbi:hypothetical protein GGF50DRAFT_117897 [Schizophyllum commune]